MLDAKIDICNAVDNLHTNGEINEDSITNIASKRARSYLHFNDIHSFIYDYCGYMRYEPEELPVLMSTDSSSESEGTILSEVDTILSEEIAILSEVDTILSEAENESKRQKQYLEKEQTEEVKKIKEKELPVRSASKTSESNKSNKPSKSSRVNLPVRERVEKQGKTQKHVIDNEPDDFDSEDDYENDEPTSRALLISIVALLIIGAIITGIVIAILQI